MHFFGTKHFVYAGIAVMIVFGLTLAGTAVALTVMMPVFVVLIPILIPAVFTLSFLATGFLASGSLGASAIGLLVWLYKKEKHSSYTLHVREVRPERANKLPVGGKLQGGDMFTEKNKLAEINKLAEELDKLAKAEEKKVLGKDKLQERKKPAEKDKPVEKVKLMAEDKPPRINELVEELDEPPEEDKLAIADEDKPLIEKFDEPPVKNKLVIPEEDKPLMEKLDEPVETNNLVIVEEDKPQERDKSPEKEKPVVEVKPTEEGTSIHEISKVLLWEQIPTGPKFCGPSPSTKRAHQNRFAMDPNKARSIFTKECQKVPRVGAFAYKYFTSRDKKYVNYNQI